MRKMSLERIETIEQEQRALDFEKEFIEFKAAVNKKFTLFNKNNDARTAKKFLLLGCKEFNCIRAHHGKLYDDSIEKFEIPFILDDAGGFELWAMQIVLLPNEHSYIEIGIDREV